MKELNVVNIIPRERHPLIFKPLYYQFIHEREGQVAWEYQKEGPDLWKVKITKI